MAGFLGGGIMTPVEGATNDELSEKQQGLETDGGGLGMELPPEQ